MIGDSPGSAGGSITGGSGTQVGCGGFSLGGMSTGGSVGEVGGGCIGGMGWGAGNGMGISSIKKAKLWRPKLARTWRRDCQTKPHSHSVICTARSGTGCKRAHASSPATGSLASWSVLAAARWLRGFATLPAPGLAPLMFFFPPMRPTLFMACATATAVAIALCAAPVNAQTRTALHRRR